MTRTTPAPEPRPTAAQRARAISLFQALAHDGRLLVLLSLAREGAQSVGQLQDATGLEQSALSHQLRLLKKARLVTGTRQGQHIIYALQDDHVVHMVQDALAHATERAAPLRRGQPGAKGAGNDRLCNDHPKHL